MYLKRDIGKLHSIVNYIPIVRHLVIIFSINLFRVENVKNNLLEDKSFVSDNNIRNRAKFLFL